MSYKYYAGYYSGNNWTICGHGKTIKSARFNLLKRCLKKCHGKKWFDAWFGQERYEEGFRND